MPVRRINRSKQGEDPGVGPRLRIIIGEESIVSFSKRLGIARAWLYRILNGDAGPEASVATLSSIADNTGYSLDWLLTGKGMPSDRWNEATVLIPRVAPQRDGRRTVTLKKLEEDLVLISARSLKELGVKAGNAGVLAAGSVDLAGLTNASDDLLLDLADHAPVPGGIFVIQTRERTAIRRALKTEDHNWIMIAEEGNRQPSALVSGHYRVLARVRLIWKKL